MTVSLLGDGIYFVAIVWEALRFSDSATTVSLVGIAWTLPTVVFLLLGGVLSDRLNRRRLMLGATLVQAFAIGLIGSLAVAGALQIWELLSLVAIYGGAQAFFIPAFEAIVPTLVISDELTQASALDQFARPISLQLIGPAVGGVLIAAAGAGVAFLADAATFLAAAAAWLAMHDLPAARSTASAPSLKSLREALRFARTNPWLSRTLLAASVTLLVFVGPTQILLPLIVKNVLHAGSGTLGAIRATGGVGALVGAVAIGQSGLPHRCIRAMFLGWALQCLALVGYALTIDAWAFALISLLAGACGAIGNIVWGTLMKTRVPNHLLGRVASLDWLISIALVPASFALTAPVAHAIGARATLLGGGLLSCATLLACLFASRLTAPDGDRATNDGNAIRHLYPAPSLAHLEPHSSTTMASSSRI